MVALRACCQFSCCTSHARCPAPASVQSPARQSSLLCAVALCNRRRVAGRRRRRRRAPAAELRRPHDAPAAALGRLRSLPVARTNVIATALAFMMVAAPAAAWFMLRQPAARSRRLGVRCRRRCAVLWQAVKVCFALQRSRLALCTANGGECSCVIHVLRHLPCCVHMSTRSHPADSRLASNCTRQIDDREFTEAYASQAGRLAAGGSQPQQGRSPGSCYHCGQPGHWANK